MNFLSKASNLLNCFIDVIFPQRCFICKNFSRTEGLCQTCWKKITWISEPKCKICGCPFEFKFDSVCFKCISKKPYFDKAISAFEYDDYSKPLIVMFKHYDVTILAKYLSKIMYAASQNEIECFDVVVPVPITLSKRLKRKYNQSELLARYFSKLSRIEYAPEVLIKTKDTVDQEKLSAKNRKKNLSEVFSISSNKKINGKNVILIDDVFTTGATANECAKVLKKNGAKNIIVITAARVSDKKHGRGERI